MGAFDWIRITALAVLGLFGLPAAGSQVAPTDYFTSAIVTGAFGAPSLPDLVTPVPSVSTGQSGSHFSLLSYSSSMYFDPILGINGSTGTLLSSGSAAAHANLALGILRASAGTTLMNVTPGFCCFPHGAEGIASFGDTLYFFAPGVSSTQVTTVDFSIDVHGSLESIPGFGPNQQYGGSFWALVGTAATFVGGYNPTIQNVQNAFSLAETYLDLGGSTGLINKTIHGSFSFIGPSATVPVFLQLGARGQYGFADFSNTAVFNFAPLPSGVSFTSASGVFLTKSPSPVPLPAAGGLLLGALGAVSVLGRRRRPTTTA